jgi:dienelactone hydrolase
MNAKPPSSAYFDTFYTTESSLKKKFVKGSRQSGYHKGSESDVIQWQQEARKLFGELIGLSHFEKIKMEPRKVSATLVEDVMREEWLVLTEEDVWVPVTLLVPEKIKQAPAVICFHGHGMAGRMGPSGRHDLVAMKKVFDQYQCDYGWKLAKMGVIAVCPDSRGFGQRREGRGQLDIENPESFYHGHCRPIQLASLPIGISIQGMWAWDAMRLIDWLETDTRVDAKRLGCAGLSGGGLQSLNLVALDTRIKAAIVSGYFYGVRESLQEMNENCMCNMVPHLWEHFDMGDIGALASPRALFIETGDADHLNGKSGLANVTSQTAIAAGAYADLKAENQFFHHIFSGPHTWNGQKAIPWLIEKLG